MQKEDDEEEITTSNSTSLETSPISQPKNASNQQQPPSIISLDVCSSTSDLSLGDPKSEFLPIIRSDLDEEIAPKSPMSRKKSVTLTILDHLLNLALFSPLVIFYWASTWDIISSYIFPKDEIVSYVITFVCANTILLISYFLQDKLQAFHDRLNESRRSGSRNYYDRRFFFRLVYTYTLTLAYVFQWRTYWDVYNQLTKQVKFEYFLAVSFITLVLCRYLLNSSLGSFVKTAPFHLQPDLKFNGYFVQAKVKFFENVIVL